LGTFIKQPAIIGNLKLLSFIIAGKIRKQQIQEK